MATLDPLQLTASGTTGGAVGGGTLAPLSLTAAGTVSGGAPSAGQLAPLTLTASGTVSGAGSGPLVGGQLAPLTLVAMGTVGGTLLPSPDDVTLFAQGSVFWGTAPPSSDDVTLVASGTVSGGPPPLPITGQLNLVLGALTLFSAQPGPPPVIPQGGGGGKVAMEIYERLEGRLRDTGRRTEPGEVERYRHEPGRLIELPGFGKLDESLPVAELERRQREQEDFERDVLDALEWMLNHDEDE